MRMRRTLIAPVILTIGTVGSLVVGPVVALTTAASPVPVAVASAGVSPNAFYYDG